MDQNQDCNSEQSAKCASHGREEMGLHEDREGRVNVSHTTLSRSPTTISSFRVTFLPHVPPNEEIGHFAIEIDQFFTQRALRPQGAMKCDHRIPGPSAFRSPVSTFSLTSQRPCASAGKNSYSPLCNASALGVKFIHLLSLSSPSSL